MMWIKQEMDREWMSHDNGERLKDWEKKMMAGFMKIDESGINHNHKRTNGEMGKE